jgi:lipopolysaccharide/colanic/teichoic acid biosynthesis glycosyltransferase
MLRDPEGGLVRSVAPEEWVRRGSARSGPKGLNSGQGSPDSGQGSRVEPLEKSPATCINQGSFSVKASGEALERRVVRRRIGNVPGSTQADLSRRLRESLAALERKRVFDIVVAVVALIFLSPLIALVALAVKLDSPGPVFFRCMRVGRNGRALAMLKFRKMRQEVAGPPLTAADDDRFTRIGGLLARTKLDEIPQLWNVLRGDMSLVGPRPEDPAFLGLHPDAFTEILQVRPGITGLSQLAFANEAKVLAADDRVRDYIERVLPQKIGLDRLYVERRSLSMDLRVLAWTLAAIVLREDAAVHRGTGRLTLRRPREPRVAAALADSPALANSTREA